MHLGHLAANGQPVARAAIARPAAVKGVGERLLGHAVATIGNADLYAVSCGARRHLDGTPLAVAAGVHHQVVEHLQHQVAVAADREARLAGGLDAVAPPLAHRLTERGGISQQRPRILVSHAQAARRLPQAHAPRAVHHAPQARRLALGHAQVLSRVGVDGAALELHAGESAVASDYGKRRLQLVHEVLQVRLSHPAQGRERLVHAGQLFLARAGCVQVVGSLPPAHGQGHCIQQRHAHHTRFRDAHRLQAPVAEGVSHLEACEGEHAQERRPPEGTHLRPPS